MKRVVIKIGSGVVYGRSGKFARARFGRVVEQIRWLQKHKTEVLCVVSGAVALGARGREVDSDRARRHAAAIGQARLIAGICASFHQHGLTVAQLLVTVESNGSIFGAGRIHDTIEKCVSECHVPVINGNDPTSLLVNNDTLVVRIAELVSADQILILTTAKGSPYSVGGRETKSKALEMSQALGIPLLIKDSNVRNVVVNSVL